MRVAICVNNGGYRDDLKVRTVYKALPDESAERSGYVRIIDETGEDYLYPDSCFVFTDLPENVGEMFSIPDSVAGEAGRKYPHADMSAT